jgi:hypothetical protein
MKKRLLLVCLMVLLTGIVFADHPADGVGIGLYFGGGSGTVGGGLFNPGLSLKFPSLPVFWGANAFFGSTTGLGVTADFYLFDRDLVKDGSFDLDWFLGIGGFGHFFFGNTTYLALGARLPIGLSWHMNRTFELFLDVIPAVGLRFTKDFFYWAGGGELGLRAWI